MDVRFIKPFVSAILAVFRTMAHIEAIKAGVNNYVVKPFTVETLRAKIDQTMARAGQAVSVS